MGRAVVATLLALCPLLAGAACTAGQSRQNAASSRVAASWFGLRRSGAFRVLGAVDYRKKTGVYTAGGLEPVLFTADATYIPVANHGPYPAGEFGGRRWVKYDPPASSLAEFEMPLFDQVASSPSDLLRFLRAAGTVEKLGTATEKGERVVRVRLSLQLGRSLRALPRRERSSFRSTFLTYWPRFAGRGIPADLAVDSDGRLRRVDITRPTWKGVTWRIEFFDYGTDVHAKAPRADQVMTPQEFDRLSSGG